MANTAYILNRSYPFERENPGWKTDKVSLVLQDAYHYALYAANALTGRCPEGDIFTCLGESAFSARDFAGSTPLARIRDALNTARSRALDAIGHEHDREESERLPFTFFTASNVFESLPRFRGYAEAVKEAHRYLASIVELANALNIDARSGHRYFEPAASEPAASEPVASEPAASEPVEAPASEPAAPRATLDGAPCAEPSNPAPDRPRFCFVCGVELVRELSEDEGLSPPKCPKGHDTVRQASEAMLMDLIQSGEIFEVIRQEWDALTLELGRYERAERRRGDVREQVAALISTMIHRL